MNTPGVICERDPFTQGVKYRFSRAGAALSYAEAIELLAHEPNFRSDLTLLLSATEYKAIRWETPPVTHARVGRPFEFVLVHSPYLATMDTEPEAFGSYFKGVSQETHVLAIPNLGKTATLIVPRQIAAASTYGHLAAFVRGAPEAQIHQLWQCVAETVRANLSSRPIWLSTAGAGVAWLHVRVEGSPKYYSYRPYAHDA